MWGLHGCLYSRCVMKTNGLVWSACLALVVAFCPGTFAADDHFGKLASQESDVIDLNSPEAYDPVDPDVDETELYDVGRHERRSPWFVGTEFTYLAFHANNGGTITASFSDTTAPGVSSERFVINEYQDQTFTPRIWAGRRIGEQFGVVVRYWQLDQFNEDPPTPVASSGTNFATFRQESYLEMYALDLEGMWQCKLGRWSFDFTGGVRQAEMQMQQSLYSFGVFTTGNFINLYLANGAHVRATGGTGSITARRRLGESNAHFFGTIRASGLVGESDSYGRSSGTIASSPSAPLVGAATVTRNNSNASHPGLEIVEVQMGVQWEHRLREFPSTFFFRVAAEYQSWYMNGPPTGGAGFGGTIGEITTNSFASAGLGGAELYGVAISTGLTW
jgi:hypothetical protein